MMLRRAAAAIKASPRRHSSSTFGTRRFSVQLEDNNTPGSWERFLQGGLAGATHADVEEKPGGKASVRIHWEDGHRSVFPAKWLRDHATEAFNSYTKQREVRPVPQVSTYVLGWVCGIQGETGGKEGYWVCIYLLKCVHVSATCCEHSGLRCFPLGCVC